MNYEGPDLL